MTLHPFIVVVILVAFGIHRLVTVSWSADDPRSPVSTIIFVIAGSVGYTVLYNLVSDKSGWGDVLILATAIGLAIYMIAGIIMNRKPQDD